MQELHRTVWSEIDRKMRRITGRETSEEQSGGYRTVCTSERHGGPAGSVRALVGSDNGMEMLEIAEKPFIG